MTWIRLKQVALVAHDLEAVVGELEASLGLAVAYRDPAVAMFGLHNAVLPVGNQFIEVVSPTKAGTAGGRQLERLGGDGGYMVICHTDDQPSVRERLGPLGVRTVFEHDDHGYLIMQLHPADTGGSFLEVDFQPGGEDPSGPWTPAGDDWQRARRTDVVDSIAGVVVQSREPSGTASRWSAITDGEVVGDVLQLDDATVEFREGPVDAVIAVALTATDPAAHGRELTIGGVDFTLA